MQILLRIVLIVKMILLSAVVHANTGDDGLSDKGYRIELIIYRQPDNHTFGNIQTSKYLHFLSSQGTQIDPTVAYTDNQQPSTSISSILAGLKSHSLPFINRAWVVQLNKTPIGIPIDATISDDDDLTASLTNGISLHGDLKFSHNLYVDLAANIQFEQLVSGNVVLFDECVEKRHLKLNKLYYLDNETIGLVLRVSQTEFVAHDDTDTATEVGQSEQEGLEVDSTQTDQTVDVLDDQEAIEGTSQAMSQDTSKI